MVHPVTTWLKIWDTLYLPGESCRICWISSLYCNTPIAIHTLPSLRSFEMCSTAAYKLLHLDKEGKEGRNDVKVRKEVVNRASQNFLSLTVGYLREWRFSGKKSGKRQNRGFIDAVFGHFEPKRETAENSK